MKFNKVDQLWIEKKTEDVVNKAEFRLWSYTCLVILGMQLGNAWSWAIYAAALLFLFYSWGTQKVRMRRIFGFTDEQTLLEKVFAKIASLFSRKKNG